MPVIYADVVWLVNFIMDAVMLFTCCWVLKQPKRWGRVLGGGAIGATYALLLFIPPLTTLTTWPGKALASFLIVCVGVPAKNWLARLKAVLVFYLIAFVFAGSAIALHFAVPGVSVASGTIIRGNHLAFIESVGSLALVAAIPVGMGTFRFVLERAKQIRQMHALLYEVYVQCGSREVHFQGLVDTGNQLRDPLTRRPVCMVDAQCMLPLLPVPLQEAVKKKGDLFVALEMCSEDPFVDKVVLVPYRGAGGGQSLALGIRPDAVMLEMQGQRTAVTTPCIFALHTDRISNDGRFQAILHTDIVMGVDGLETDLATEKVEHQTAHSLTAPVDTSSNSPSWRS